MDPFGIVSVYAPHRMKRPDNYAGEEKLCPFCQFEEKDRLLWEDDEAFIVWNKYPPTKYSFVLVAKEHSLEEKAFSKLFGRMVNAFLQEGERWVGEGCYPLIFRNKGPLSGASLEHEHAQLVCVERPFFKPEAVSAFLQNLKEEHRVRDNLFAYPEPTRDYQLLYIFNNIEDEGEWEETGRAVEAVKEAYRRWGKVLHSYNTILILPPSYSDKANWEFPPFLIILPRPNAIAGIEWLTRVATHSIPPERVAKEIRELLEGQH